MLKLMYKKNNIKKAINNNKLINVQYKTYTSK